MVSKGPKRPRRLSTEIVHHGRDPFAQNGFVNTPVYRGSTVLFPDLETLETGNQRYTYGRKGSPSMSALEDALTNLEGGVACYLMPSGLSAVTTTLLAFVKTGDHILMADTVYQPSRRFASEVLTTFGVEVQFYDPQIGGGIARLMKQQDVYAYRFSGKRYDCGSKLGYLQATVEYGLKHPQLGGAFRTYLQGMFKS